MKFRNNNLFIKIFELEITYFEMFKFCFYSLLFGFLRGCIYYFFKN